MVTQLKNQLTLLQSQLTTGNKSTSYAGMGVNEDFAIAARSQLASISAFSDTMSNINVNIGVANTAAAVDGRYRNHGSKQREQFVSGAQQRGPEHRATDRYLSTVFDAGDSEYPGG